MDTMVDRMFVCKCTEHDIYSHPSIKYFYSFIKLGYKVTTKQPSSGTWLKVTGQGPILVSLQDQGKRLVSSSGRTEYPESYDKRCL